MQSVTVDKDFDLRKDAKWGTLYWVDQERVTTPATGKVVYVNYWWLVNEDNQVCLYAGRSPQANVNPEIVDKVMKNIPGAVGKVLIPFAYLDRD